MSDRIEELFCEYVSLRMSIGSQRPTREGLGALIWADEAECEKAQAEYDAALVRMAVIELELSGDTVQ